MWVRVTSLVLGWLLLAAAVTASPAAGERLGRELAAASSASERLYLPSSASTRAISLEARSERQPARLSSVRANPESHALGGRFRSFVPEPPASHDKRPLPRRGGADPREPAQPD